MRAPKNKRVCYYEEQQETTLLLGQKMMEIRVRFFYGVSIYVFYSDHSLHITCFRRGERLLRQILCAPRRFLGHVWKCHTERELSLHREIDERDIKSSDSTKIRWWDDEFFFPAWHTSVSCFSLVVVLLLIQYGDILPHIIINKKHVYMKSLLLLLYIRYKYGKKEETLVGNKIRDPDVSITKKVVTRKIIHRSERRSE